MMKLKIKTISGTFHEIEVSPSDSIESIKKSINSQTQIPIESQKIIFGTNLLRDEQKLEDYSISEKDILVLLQKRSPKPVSVGKDLTPVPTKSIILEYTSYGKTIKPMKPASTPTNAISQLRNQLQDLMGSLVGLGANSGPTTNEPTNAPAEEETEGEEEQGPITVEVDADALKHLQEMGFPEGRSKKALLLNRMNPALAMEWLLEHDGDADIDEPLNPQQLRQFSRRATRFSPDQAAITKLKDMGFAEEDIIQALRITNNNSEAACAYLLGEGGEAEFSLDDTNIIHDVLMNPTIQAGLSNPRVLQALKALIENPSSAAQFISDPEIGPVLIQVHNIIQGQGNH